MSTPLSVVFRLLVFSWVFLSCRPAPIESEPRCTPQSCGGCCNGDRCESGTAAQSCGVSGVACVSCARDLMCSAGQCVERQVDDPKDAGAPRRVFVTRTAYSGDLKSAGAAADGLAGADALCAIAAQSTSLGGTWRAWLSTTTVKAQDRIVGDGPWVDLKGNVVFNNKANFFTGPLRRIEYDERGDTTVVRFTTGETQGVTVWSGTTSNLTVTRASFGAMEMLTCLDWTTDDRLEMGGFGTSDNSDNGVDRVHDGLRARGRSVTKKGRRSATAKGTCSASRSELRVAKRAARNQRRGVSL